MRHPTFLALAGLAALCSAVPTPDEAKNLKDRQFSIGNPSVTLCIGSCRPSSPIIGFPAQPTGGIHIGRDEQATKTQERREEEVDGIVKSCSALASALSPDEANSAYQLLIDECFILLEKHDVDFKILGAWSEVRVSTKAKRQTGVIIIGACTEEDVQALVTQFQTMVAQYGREHVPYDVAVLMQAIKAALFYCALASPTTAPAIPPEVIIGTPIIPDPAVPGSPITPDPTVPGGPMNPDPVTPADPVARAEDIIIIGPVKGGPVIPEKPIPGGPLVPEKPSNGGPLVPDEAVEGGTVQPGK